MHAAALVRGDVVPRAAAACAAGVCCCWQFRADGFNHFICNDFPAHSHWRLDNAESPTPKLYINWGKYGEYELDIAADGKTMAGSAKGQPDNWRKATRLKALGDVEEAHVHDH